MLFIYIQWTTFYFFTYRGKKGIRAKYDYFPSLSLIFGLFLFLYLNVQYMTIMTDQLRTYTTVQMFPK